MNENNQNLQKYTPASLQKLAKQMAVVNKLLGEPKNAEWFNTAERRLSWWNSLDEDWKQEFNDNYSFMNEDPLSPPTDFDLELIFEMKKLRWFNSSCNLILKDKCPLSNLTNLKHIEIFLECVHDFGFLTNLNKLTHLTLFINNIEEIPSFSFLPNIQRLDLVGGKIINFEGLRKLTNLVELNIEQPYSVSTNIAALSCLTNLTKLRLWDYSVTDISSLSNLTNLEELEISCGLVTDISPLSSLVNLTKLELECKNYINIEPLYQLPNLQSFRSFHTAYDELQINNLREIANHRGQSLLLDIE